jgi:hypothetical protein
LFRAVSLTWLSNFGTRFAKRIAVVGLVVALGACGFTPVYQQDGETSGVDGLVSNIEAPTSLQGRQLSRSLQTSLKPAADGLLRLSITLQERQEGQIFDPTGKPENYLVEHIAVVEFADQTGKVMAMRDFKYYDSFAKNDNEAVNIATRERIRNLAMRRFANQIRQAVPRIAEDMAPVDTAK